MCELWGSVTWNTAQLLYHKVWSVSVEALKEKDDYARPPPVWPCQWWFIVVSCCAVKTSEYGKRKGWNVFSHHHLFKAWSFSLFLTFSTLWKLNISFKYGVFFYQCSMKIKTWLSTMRYCFCIFVFDLNWVLNGSLLQKGNDSFPTWMLMLQFQPSDLAQVTLMIL